MSGTRGENEACGVESEVVDAGSEAGMDAPDSSCNLVPDEDACEITSEDVDAGSEEGTEEDLLVLEEQEGVQNPVDWVERLFGIVEVGGEVGWAEDYDELDEETDMWLERFSLDRLAEYEKPKVTSRFVDAGWLERQKKRQDDKAAKAMAARAAALAAPMTPSPPARPKPVFVRHGQVVAAKAPSESPKTPSPPTNPKPVFVRSLAPWTGAAAPSSAVVPYVAGAAGVAFRLRGSESNAAAGRQLAEGVEEADGHEA